MRVKFLLGFGLVSFWLLSCGGPLALSDSNYTPPQTPSFQGEIIEKYKMSAMTLGEPIILDTSLTAWKGAKGEILVFDHFLRDQVKKIEGKKPIDGLTYLTANFFWTEVEKEKNYVRFDLKPDKEIWRIEGEPLAAEPLAMDNRALFAGVSGNIQCVSVDSGNVLWENKLTGQIFETPVANEQSVFVVNDKGTVYAYDLAEGEQLWKKPINQPVLIMTLKDESLYLGTFQGEMVSLDIGSQEIKWRIKTGYQVRNFPLVIDSMIYWVNVNGEVLKIDQDTGEYERLTWLKIPTSGRPVMTEDGILVAGEDMILYCIDTQDGNIISKTEFDGRLRSSPIFIQHRWFIAVEDHWLYEIQ